MAIARRKQSMSHEDFIALWHNVPRLVPPEALERLVDATLGEIDSVCRGRAVASGWSGGKDSLVLYALLQQLGLRRAVMVITNLEFSAFLQWVTDHMPAQLDILNTGQDLAWLARHPDMLFPRNSTLAGRWFHQVQHQGQDQYFRREKLEVLVLGRRRDDGNFCGDDKGLYTTAAGVTRYAPLRHWRQEDVLAYLYYNSVPLPPIYRWPRGFRVGTGPWPARQWCESERQGWEETWQIDPSVVEEAASVLPGARAFLASREP